MITKIHQIKNFGSFKNFTWTATLEEFKRFNLIYGWNGSGKTTFSKLFTLLEQKNDVGLIKNLREYEFNIALNDTSLNQDNYQQNSLNLYVYNEVFKDKNINWDTVIKSILLVSDEVITEKAELEDIKNKLGNENIKDSILWNIKENSSKKSNLEKNIDDFYRDSAKKIKDDFKVIDTSDTYYFNYDKRKFQNFIDKNIEKISNKTSQLKSEEVAKLKESIKPNILPVIELELKNITIEWLNKIRESVLNVSRTSLVVNEIGRLKEHADIGQWVEKGIEIHKFYNSTKCEFCNQNLPTTRLKELEKHFSDEFKKLKEKILNAIEWLPQQKISNELFKSEIEFYPEYKEEFKDIKTNIKIAIESINELFDEWLKSLKTKQENPFEIIEIIEEVNEKSINSYNILISNFKELIKKHNNKTENFEKESKNLKEKLELHFGTLYFSEFEIKKKNKEIETLNIEISKNSNTKIELERKKKELEAKLSDEAFGAKEFNEKLHKFLGRNNILLEFDKDNQGYKIIRDGEQATNLSEGEKTAISFVYFVTKIRENDNKIEDSIIVVDDPISSFDSNNLFSAYSFLKNECEKAKQLFVITHSFAYFKLVRDWFAGKNKKKNGNLVIKSNFYLIEAMFINLIRHSSIKYANDSLTKYNSEYHFIFSQVYSFKSEPLDESKAYLIGNLLRKLLEAFLSFKYPLKRNDFKQLCDDSILDEQLREKVYRFINKYSHNQTIEFFDSTDDTVLSESTTIVNDVLEKIIQKIDCKHFEEMEKMVREKTIN